MNFIKHKIGAALLGVALLTLSHCAHLTNTAAAQSASIRVKRAVIPAGSNGRFLQLAFVRDKRARVTIDGGASATVNGVTISSLAVNEAGAVRALVSADCEATDASFTLRAAIGRDTLAWARLRVFVLNNPPPTLSYGEAQIVAPGGTATIKPARGLSDQGRIASVAVRRVTPRFKGRIEVDEQGVVSISKAPSRGSFKVTIRATDDCGEYTDASFTLQVAVTSACAFEVEPTYQRYAQAGGAGEVKVLTGQGCAWTAVSKTPWLSITSPAKGSGSAVTRFTVAKNTDGRFREGYLKIAGRYVSIAQTREGVIVRSVRDGAETGESQPSATVTGEAQPAEPATGEGKKKKAKKSEAANEAEANEEVKKGKAKKRDAANDEAAEPEVKKAKAKKGEAKIREAKPEKVKKALEDTTIK